MRAALMELRGINMPKVACVFPFIFSIIFEHASRPPRCLVNDGTVHFYPNQALTKSFEGQLLQCGYYCIPASLAVAGRLVLAP